MTDELNHTPSQVIDAPGPTSENPNISPEPPKEEPKPQKMTAQDAIEKAMGPEKSEEDDGKPAKVEKSEDKPNPEVKPAKAERSAEPVKADAVNERETPPKVEGQSEGRKTAEAPARFLPKAKEQWISTPRPVREEVERIFREHETEKAQYAEHKQFRDDIREYEEFATSKGVKFKDAISRYVDIDQKFSQDPAMGFRQLLQNTGMTVQQAVGHILRSVNATPQQLIDRITAAPHEFVFAAPQPQQQQFQQPQQAQENPQVKALEERLARMEEARVQREVIEPFVEEYPDYYQYEDAIAEVLKTGIIDKLHGTGISPRDRLERAYAMVAPVKPGVSMDGNSNALAPVPSQRDTSPVVDLRGTKSIKGAPHGVQTDRRGKMSKEDAINEAMARFGS